MQCFILVKMGLNSSTWLSVSRLVRPRLSVLAGLSYLQ